MTKEERAEKWFRNMPGAAAVSMETKMAVCDKVAKKMMLTVLALLAAECILLFMVADGEVFTQIANFLDRISGGSHTRNHFRGMAIAGILLGIPFIALPIGVAMAFKSKWMKAEIAKRETQPPASRPIKEETEEMLRFDHLNFKLAIIQVLMYDLEVLQPRFDIYDFADQYEGEEIDTESEDVIQTALDFFARLSIPRRLAAQVEEIYMDGGNDIYLNIIPQWDGEDDSFDLGEVTAAELSQFPNLKKASILSGDYDAVKEVFVRAGIDVSPT